MSREDRRNGRAPGCSRTEAAGAPLDRWPGGTAGPASDGETASEVELASDVETTSHAEPANDECGRGERRSGTRSFRRDCRGAAPVATVVLLSTFELLVVSVFAVPVGFAVVGSLVRTGRAAEYAVTAAASLVAVFTITGTQQFATHWAALGVLAVLAAIGAHLWQYRRDRLDLLVVGGIYAMPLGLGVVLLWRGLVGF